MNPGTDVLRIENTFSWLHTQDEEVRQKLWQLLRFRDPEAFWSPRYRARVWDGYHEFFKKDSGRFLTGLLPEVKATLSHFGRGHSVEDTRQPFPFTTPSIDENYLLAETGMTLRDYQVQNVNKGIANKRGIIWAPVASGKTACLQSLVKACPEGSQVLVLGNKKGLVDQNYDALSQARVHGLGRLYGGVFEEGRVMCATWQSCHKLAAWLPKVQALFVDEIQEMTSRGVKGVYRLLEEAAVRIAFSATPFKHGGRDNIQKYDVKGWIGAPFLIDAAEDGKLSTKDLQGRKIVSTCDCMFYPIDQPGLSEYLLYGDAVTQGIAENAYFHDTVARLARGLRGRTLIIVERIAHGDQLLDRLPQAVWVRGKDTMRTRKAVIERLKRDEGDVVAIATSGIFNTGIDVWVHQLVNAAGGKAEHAIIQRLGRGLRKAKDKDHLRYYDFLFRLNQYLDKHSDKRVEILRRQGHSVSIREAFDF